MNEDTYDFQGFDLVLLPAVKAARLKMVESLQNGKTLKQALAESLAQASADDKKVMTETLNNLNIDYTTAEKAEDNKDLEETDIAANDAGANMVKDLQESLLKQQTLEAQITELQEKLSVCYAKEAKYEDDIAKYKGAIRNLSESVNNAKALKTKVESLQEELRQKDEVIKAQNDKKDIMMEKLSNQKSLSISEKAKLTESLSAKNLELVKAKNQISKLQENLESYKVKESALNEDLAEQKKNLAIKSNDYNTKLSKANKLIEQYRNTAKTAVNKYIESKAVMLGVKTEEIKNKLPSNYSFDDIDSICESVSKYKLQINRLPFNVGNNTKIAIKESKEIKRQNSSNDDTIDDSLIRLAKLN